MTPEELAAELEAIVAEAQLRLGIQLGSTNKAMFNQIQALLGKLDISDDGLIRQTQANRKLLLKVDKYINSALNSSGYYSSLDTFAGHITEITNTSGKYFRTLSEGFNANTRYIKSLQRNAIAEIEGYLANDGLHSVLRRPMVSILNQNINTGAAISDLTKQMREFILGSEKLQPTLTRYANTITRSTLFDYSSSLQESVSQDLGLQFYIYSGGARKDSRDFCVARTGQFFHKREVEKWAKLNWSGKRQGTNSSNIFIYRGGWNCEHQLIAVSELIVPEEVIERAKKAGYYQSK